MINSLIAVLICAVVILSFRCYRLKQALAQAKRQSLHNEDLFHRTFQEMVKSNEKAIKMRMSRDVWLERWKSGAFEMDAATMAKLAEEEVTFPDTKSQWPPTCRPPKER